ncbi:MAG: homoserine O-acetyltransferase [Bacteroidia bacterium]
MSVRYFTYDQDFALESGAVLPGFQLAYHTGGTLHPSGDNVVWACHALTGNSVPQDWWPGLFEAGGVFDPAEYFWVCANMLGSCYGSTHALSPHPSTGQPWYHDFPLLTNRDMVRAFDLLREHLGIERVRVLTGGSLGGQQALEWAVMRPEVFDCLIPVATNARHSAWGIAFNEAQRMAIAADATWQTATPTAGMNGMRAARATALLSYRSYQAYVDTQTETQPDKLDDYRAASYQRYQGEKLYRRFNAFSYWTLSRAMDSHDLGRGRGGVEAALAQIRARTLVVGVDSDLLFPPAEQQLLARHIPDARYAEIASPYGHDGFLVETRHLQTLIRAFLEPVAA